MRWMLAFLLFAPSLLSAQKWVGQDVTGPVDDRTARIQWGAPGQTVATDRESVSEFLSLQLRELDHPASGLELLHHNRSPKAEHYQLAQTLHGRPIFRATVKMNVSKDGRILSILDRAVAIPEHVDSDFPDHSPYHAGLAEHYETPGNGKLDHYQLEEVFFPQGDSLIPAIRLEVTETTDRYYELVLNKEVRVIYQNDLLSYAAPQDSTVTLWVFDPDPLTTANQQYGAPYADNNDQDVAELNAERFSRTATATFENDTFLLRNAYASIEDFSPPSTPATISLDGNFNFTRSENGFEDAMTFYHISHYQEYMQSLGFTDLVNYPIAIDAHALGGSDNSSFNPGHSPPRLSFGEGGVDDAEDTDVIIHEYGHAIMHSAAPGTNNGTERRTLDEAIGDYFAASYSRSVDPFRWEDVYTWDGHNEFWPGRSAMSTDHYPEDLNGNIYSDADIWSATLMQIWEDIGREATDAIMLQAGYSFSGGMTMPQAALLFLQADTLLFGGAHFDPIRQRMFDRGLLPWEVSVAEPDDRSTPAFQVLGTGAFAAGNAPLRVILGESATLKLYNAIGQLLWEQNASQGTFLLSPTEAPKGILFLRIENGDRHAVVKLIRW